MLAALLLSLALFGQAPDGQGRRPGGPQTPGQQPTITTTTQTQPGSQTGTGQRPPQERPSPVPEETPVITHHEITVGGKTLKYTATVGMMPLKNRDGETEARIFFMAYTLDGVSDRQKRPLTFSFNGGPGSASVWLHMGALGPRRVPMNPDGTMPAPPYHLVDNEYTWLDQSDLVFIDPVGTGYSRAVRPEVASRFFSLQGDIESVGEFIRMYLTRSERWTSPLFLAGESYGTTRASALSGYLIGRGIAFNGIVLISTIMNFETTDFASGNDLPYVMYLPSYAATAWYHKKLPRDMQAKSVQKVVAEAEEWAANDYTLALEKGDRLSGPERQETINKLARFTGIDPKFIDNANLRVSLNFFRKELLRDEKRSIGRLDARFKGYDSSYVTAGPDFDASEAAIRPPYTSTFNNYIRQELNFKSDSEYYILGGGIGPWNWGTNNGYVDTSVALRTAMAQNPYLKIFVAMGYYDMATPYFAVQYTMHHISLDPGLLKNFSTSYYEAGHMMYIDEKQLGKLRGDVRKFIDESQTK
ncbi:MAG TPA: peptidase S10 [Blastocatellia bacterium]|nr:peptidase S10 [Blastocatellia bacterium]